LSNSPTTNGIANLINGEDGYGVWRWRDLIAQGVLVANQLIGEGVYVATGGWQQGFDWGSVTPYLWNNSTGQFYYL
jgi:hypothetical protein